MVSEFWDRGFDCSSLVLDGPGYDDIPDLSRVCSVVCSRVGSTVVLGDYYVRSSFGYEKAHMWMYFTTFLPSALGVVAS